MQPPLGTPELSGNGAMGWLGKFCRRTGFTDHARAPEPLGLSTRNQVPQFGSRWLRAWLMLPHFPGSDGGLTVPPTRAGGQGAVRQGPPLLLVGLQGPLWLSHQAKTRGFDTIQKMKMSPASNPSLSSGNLNLPET